MAATAISGQTLKVSITPVATEIFIGGVDGWSFDNKVDSKDITSAGMTAGAEVVWKSYMATLKDASGTITLKFLDFTDAGQMAMWDLFLATNTNNLFKFYQDETHYMQAHCILTSFPINAKVDGVQGEGMSISIQLQDDNGLVLVGY